MSSWLRHFLKHKSNISESILIISTLNLFNQICLVFILYKKNLKFQKSTHTFYYKSILLTELQFVPAQYYLDSAALVLILYSAYNNKRIIMQNLLKIIQSILKSYSKLSINQLFQNNLIVTIFLIPNINVAKQLLNTKFPTIKKAKEIIFLKGEQQLKSHDKQSFAKKQKPIFIYLTINHPKMLNLHRQLLSKKSNEDLSINLVQNLICLTKNGHILDNLIEMQQKIGKQSDSTQTKAFFFKIYENKGTAQIINQLGLFLSIQEFYHSHTGLVLSLHEINNLQHFQFLSELSQNDFSQDDDELLSCSQYCRLFQAMPYKITNEDIALIADIEPNFWGEEIIIQQGNDGILFWFLYDRHPILSNLSNQYTNTDNFNLVNISNSQKLFVQKLGLKISQIKYSHVLLKSKLLVKEPIQNLSLTIVILNVKKMKYCQNLNQIFCEVFEKQVKKLYRSRAEQKQLQICEKSYQEISRLSELLANIFPPDSNVPQQDQIIKNEADQISYNINRWLYLKSKDQKQSKNKNQKFIISKNKKNEKD